MSKKVEFPIFSHSEIFLFEEIFFETLVEQGRSIEQSLDICKELQLILLSLHKSDCTILIVRNDRLHFSNEVHQIEKTFKYFEPNLTEAGVELSFHSFNFADEELNAFNSKQSTEQRTAYIELLNESLSETNEKVSKLVKAKSYLMNFIAHEVRNPLNTILGYSEMMLEAPDLISTKEAARVFYNQSQDIKRLVDEVLDFSKLEIKRLEVKNEKVNVWDFCTDFSSASEVLVKAKNLDWEFKVHKNINKNTHVNADEFRLKQILNNFLSNALKFTDEGTVGLYVNYCSRQNGSIVFSIKDTGKGFDPKFKEKIFSEFS